MSNNSDENRKRTEVEQQLEDEKQRQGQLQRQSEHRLEEEQPTEKAERSKYRGGAAGEESSRTGTDSERTAVLGGAKEENISRAALHDLEATRRGEDARARRIRKCERESS